jgi:DNA repair protein RadC
MENSLTSINEIGVSYKRKTLKNTSIKNSLDIYGFVREMYKSTSSNPDLKEYFFIVLLNRANKIIGYHKLSEGGICGTVVDIRLAFAIALKSLASGIILVHNHPSGNLQPSSQDISITKRFIQAGELLEITVLDHIIITDENYKSFADEGLLK